MSRRLTPLTLALPLLALGVASLGAVLTQLPGRGVEAPLVPEVTEPGFADYFATGVHLLQVGLPLEAAATFETASRLRPQVAEARINLGYAYLAAKNYARAEAAFGAALDLKPQQANGYYGWAQSLEALGDLAGALGAMRTYVHLSSEGDPYRRRALAAIWEWQTALDLSRENPTGHERPDSPAGALSSGGSDAPAQR
jgi:tetratricopeptide (TPR) repeat protein